PLHLTPLHSFPTRRSSDLMIQLNVTAPTLLTHQLLQNLQKQEAAYILNISSLAAFSPIGYKTVYPASKVFIHSFSRGLNQELKEDRKSTRLNSSHVSISYA